MFDLKPNQTPILKLCIFISKYYICLFDSQMQILDNYSQFTTEFNKSAVLVITCL